jgi:alpha-beta hydrolase superfamily lysophospholipase
MRSSRKPHPAIVSSGFRSLAPAALLMALACGQDTQRIPSNFYAPPDPLPAGEPGQLIRSESLGTPPGGGHARRVLFHSRTNDGQDIATSALFVLPEGDPPAGGFPLMAMAHGTAGLDRTCGISVQPYTATAAFGGFPQYDLVQPYVEQGFAVVAPDYQGLGAPGPASYFVGKVEGENVIDAAIAAHQLAGAALSDQLLLWGHSQGGHSAAFAAQSLRTRSVPFRLAGTVLVAPATLLGNAIQDVIDDKPVPQPGEAVGFLLFASISYAQTYPGLSLDQILTPCPAGQQVPCGALGAEIASQNCLETVIAPFLLMSEAGVRASAYVNFPLPPNWEARICENDVGAVPIPSPVLMVQGEGDTTLPVPMNCDFFENVACPEGVQIQFSLYPSNVDHTTILAAALPEIIAWQRARLSGSGAPSNCGSPPSFCGTVAPSSFCE